MKFYGLFIFILISSQATSQTQLTRRLDSLTQAYESNGYHGVIRVAKGDQLIFEKAYGFANLEEKIPHSTSTVFKTESVGKMFTAVAVLQLIEQGKLNLDQSLKELLPGINIKNADQMTIHHLLTHTSGLQSPWDHPKWSFKKKYDRQELIRIIEEVPPAFDSVGTRMYYSNSGYILLSFIVEKISGIPFDDYYRQHIFLPLQMNDTRHLNDTLMPEKNGAVPYRFLSSKRYIRLYETVGPLASGAGGWVSTARDLQLFMSALTSGKLISSSSLYLMRTANQTAPGADAYKFYAYGLETYHNQMIPGTEIFGHNGGGAGFTADAFADSVSGYIVTSCTNQYMNSRPVVENFFRVMLSQPLKPVSKNIFTAFYDEIEEKGIEAVLDQSQTIFKNLQIDPNPGFIARMSDAFIVAKDFVTWQKWMEWSQKVAPDAAFLKMVYGDGLLEMGKKEEAKKMYEAAKAQATEQKNQQVIQIADDKLKTL